MTLIPSWVMTYDSLTSTVLQYLERKDAAVVNAIPTFISLAEFEIAQEIKTLGQLQVVEATMTPDNPILQKPARWRKTVSMSVKVDGKKQPVYHHKRFCDLKLCACISINGVGADRGYVQDASTIVFDHDVPASTDSYRIGKCRCACSTRPHIQ